MACGSHTRHEVRYNVNQDEREKPVRGCFLGKSRSSGSLEDERERKRENFMGGRKRRKDERVSGKGSEECMA